jgi:hypothetical protein
MKDLLEFITQDFRFHRDEIREWNTFEKLKNTIDDRDKYLEYGEAYFVTFYSSNRKRVSLKANLSAEQTEWNCLFPTNFLIKYELLFKSVFIFLFVL